jgi:hypothetical protein
MIAFLMAVFRVLGFCAATGILVKKEQEKMKIWFGRHVVW